MLASTALLALLVALQEDSVESVTAALEQRLVRLNRLYVEYDWGEYTADASSDPFDQAQWRDAAWAPERQAPVLHCRAWVLRPDFRLAWTGPLHYHRDVQHSWIDGVHVNKTRDTQADRWSVTIDRDRWMIGGGTPLRTCLELDQTCDLAENLVDAMRRAPIARVERATAGVIVSAGPLSERSPWMLTATLDPTRDWLPIEVRLAIRVPKANKRIEWTLRTIESQVVAGSHAIREAVLAMRRPDEPNWRWQVYHYRAGAIRTEPTLTKASLKLAIPETNVLVVDEVNLFTRTVGTNGKTLHYEKWTPQERTAQLEAIKAAAAARDASARTLTLRRSAFYYITSAALVVTAVVVGVWRWRRHLAIA
ncbi:MAG: hypothetical protein CHACPFDD_03777 [Phycisphaerae bacterium]|nr:hypothetical protein [Phycisphaerae bacterium]